MSKAGHGLALMKKSISRADHPSEKALGSFDAEWSKIYRQGDQQALENGGVFAHYGLILQHICESFAHQTIALDVGCGTGRYFHCLKNVGRLVGTDLSEHMLEQARTPVHADLVQVTDITLLHGDLLTLPLETDSFDIIYSVGVYGEYAPINEQLLQRFWQLLRPGGQLFVTAVDTASRVSVPENEEPSLIRRLVRKTFPMFPHIVRAGFNRVLSPHYVTRHGLQSLFDNSRFARSEITEYVHTGGWRGTHFDCRAFK